jgi:hypothetical protein
MPGYGRYSEYIAILDETEKAVFAKRIVCLQRWQVRLRFVNS